MRTLRDGRIVPARRMHIPSERNLVIYEEVKLLGGGQAAVGQRYGLSQRRISQICLQIERWQEQVRLSQAGRDGQSERRREERREAALFMVRRRYEQIYAHALRTLIRVEKAQALTRTVGPGGQTVSEVATQPRTLKSQLLRIAIGASCKLHKMDEHQRRRGAGDPKSAVDELDAVLHQVAAAIRAARQPGDVVQGESGTKSSSGKEGTDASPYAAYADTPAADLSADRPSICGDLGAMRCQSDCIDEGKKFE